jgi:competence protein ComEC
VDSIRTPLVLPAAAFAGGALAALSLPQLAVAPLALLAFAGFALGRRTGTAVAFLALGALALAARAAPGTGPPLPGFDPSRPVEAVVRVAGHARPEERGWSAPARVLRMRQGARVATPPLDVILRLSGEGGEPPPLGARVRARGHLSRSPGFANRAPVPPGPWRLRVKSQLLLSLERPPGPAAALSAALRRRLERAYAAAGAGESPGGALARALVLGDPSRLPEEGLRGLRRTGLAHVTAVSGLHVALVAGAVWLAAAQLPGGLARRARIALSLSAVALYVLAVGPAPSLLRASAMALLAGAALLAERPPAPANALGGAVLLLVLQDPAAVSRPAFQLTVAATAGLLGIAPRLAERWSRLPSKLAAPLAASVGAQLATLPFALPRFCVLSPVSPLLNLVAVPWAALALACCLAWTALAVAAPTLAAAARPALDRVAAPFSWPSLLPPEPWASLPVLLSPAGAALLALLLAAALLLPARRALLAGVVLALGVLAFPAFAPIPGTPGRGAAGGTDPELAALDVGQGDAILLRDGRLAALVDGGGWNRGDLGARVLLPALLAEGVRRLDAVVLTHPDRDHCEGLVDVAGWLPVAEVWMGPGWEEDECAARLLALPRARVRLLAAGDQAALGRWRLSVLHPERDERRGRNERSLVLLARTRGRRFLLTGDVERWGEARLVSCCAERLRADVLKVAHHGSRTSSTESFLEAAAPRLGLVSAGVDNLYHHPAADVVARFEARGIRLLRTDRDGMIHLAVGPDGALRVSLPGSPR